MSLKTLALALLVAVVAGIVLVQGLRESVKSQEARLPTSDEQAELRSQGKLVVARGDDVEGALFTMNGDGTDARRLTVGSQAAWSPDGHRIAFERGDDVLHGETVWVGELGGEPPRKLADAWDPAWSPDGDSILVTTDQEEEGLLVRGSDLALVDPDDGDFERLSGKEGLVSFGPPTIDSAAWSPDGEWIVFRCSPTETCATRSDWGHDWLRVAHQPFGSRPEPDWRAPPAGT